ncbi:flagellar assembly protein FliX [Hansschlegelia plantiphila]|uniref:flagellar assembly protein FliX n=1 Tax=Hansschlegelia plantiphila TaxID=374655 RepID=UPI003D16FAC9
MMSLPISVRRRSSSGRHASIEASVAGALSGTDPRERRRQERAPGARPARCARQAEPALVVGPKSPHAPSTIASGLRRRRVSTSDPALDAATAAIGLRAQVELAKQGP